jgi:hypothetical protein
MVVFCVLAISAAWIAGNIATNIRQARTARYSAEIHAKFLDRCSGSQDLAAYLEHSVGLDLAQSPSTGPRRLVERLLSTVKLGMVMLLLGASLLGVRFWEDEPSIRRVLLVSGAPAAAAGAGFLLAALISYRLCRLWGLIGPNITDEARPAVSRRAGDGA